MIKTYGFKQHKNRGIKKRSFSEPVGIVGEVIIPGVQRLMLNEIIGGEEVFDAILQHTIVYEQLFEHKDGVQAGNNDPECFPVHETKIL